MGIGSPATERSRDRQLKGSFSTLKPSAAWAGPIVTKFDGQVSPSAAANTNFEVGSGEELLENCASNDPPSPSPSKPLRAASPPRAQQARIARLSSPSHAEASPTNHEIKQRRKRSAGKYLDTELLRTGVSTSSLRPSRMAHSTHPGAPASTRSSSVWRCLRRGPRTRSNPVCKSEIVPF